RNKLAAALGGLASLRLRMSDFQASKALLEEARPHHEAALKAGPENPAYQRKHRENLAVLIQANAGLGDPTATKQVAQKLRDLGWDPSGDAYAAACAISRCVPIVQTNEKASQDERDKQAALYAEEAMALLRDAVQRGFNDAGHMKQDKDLDPLRGRED